VDVKARLEIVHETPLSAVIEGHKSMGQLVGREAMLLAISKAEKSGVGMVAVRNSNHYGIAGFYTGLAVEAGLSGLCMTNTEAICVPTFGKRAMLGTSPIAFAVPASPTPFSFDAATTVVPRGKLEVRSKQTGVIPEGWALDAAGHATTDSALVLRNIIGKLGGGIAPLGGVGELFGGHKGYGLALLVDIFCGIFSGGATSNHVNTREGEEEICHFFAAFDHGLFGDRTAIEERLSVFLQELRDSPRAEGQSRIYIHGEKEAEAMAARLKNDGPIPVNDKTWEELQEIAKAQGVPFTLEAR
jgi:LDH2 family malate/lactate/ureidoglycolate dehydrogenase